MFSCSPYEPDDLQDIQNIININSCNAGDYSSSSNICGLQNIDNMCGFNYSADEHHCTESSGNNNVNIYTMSGEAFNELSGALYQFIETTNNSITGISGRVDNLNTEIEDIDDLLVTYEANIDTSNLTVSNSATIVTAEFSNNYIIIPPLDLLDPNLPDNVAAPKSYVDTKVQGIEGKRSVNRITNIRGPSSESLLDISNISNVTPELAILSSITNTNGLLFVQEVSTIDGSTNTSDFTLSERILVNAQTDERFNGIYEITDISSIVPSIDLSYGSQSFSNISDLMILNRTSDFDASNEIVNSYVFVRSGTQRNSGWVQSFPNIDTSSIVVGDTSINFVKFSQEGKLASGENISIINEKIELNPDLTDVSSISATSISTTNITTTNITADRLISTQVVPSSNDIAFLNFIDNFDLFISQYNEPDKYYYKDYVPRSRVEIDKSTADIISDLTDETTFINTPHNNRIKKSSYSTNTASSNNIFAPPNKASYIKLPDLIKEFENDNIAQYIGPPVTGETVPTETIFALITLDSSNNPLSPRWGPNVLNQGKLGDCYAFSSAALISFSYTALLKQHNQLSDNSFNEISNYMLPSMIYIEKLFNKCQSIRDGSYNPFSDGGDARYAIAYYLNNSCPLEIQYTYPLLANALQYDPSFQALSEDTKTYLVNEYIDKVINDTPNDILSVANSNKFYKIYNNKSAGTRNPLLFELIPAYNNTQTSQQQNTIDNIKILLNTNKPLTITIMIYEKDNGYYDPLTNIFYDDTTTTTNDTTFIGYHVVLLVGYNDNIEDGVFIIQNSWGNSSGFNGFFYLNYNHITTILNSNEPEVLSAWCALEFIEST